MTLIKEATQEEPEQDPIEEVKEETLEPVNVSVNATVNDVVDTVVDEAKEETKTIKTQDKLVTFLNVFKETCIHTKRGTMKVSVSEVYGWNFQIQSSSSLHLSTWVDSFGSCYQAATSW